MGEVSPAHQHKGFFQKPALILKVWEEEIPRAAGAGVAQTTCTQTRVKVPPYCL